VRIKLETVEKNEVDKTMYIFGQYKNVKIAWRACKAFTFVGALFLLSLMLLFVCLL